MDRILVQQLSDEDMKTKINKRIKAFDNKISARIANNKIIADAEYPTEIWQLDYGNLGNTHLIYNPEANI